MLVIEVANARKESAEARRKASGQCCGLKPCFFNFNTSFSVFDDEGRC